jgi:hypothetical protein
VIVDSKFTALPAPLGSQFSVWLGSGHDFFGTSGAGEIGQTGAIPADSHSLFFAAAHGVPTLSFAGQSVPVFPFQANATYTTYAADVSPYAGQTGELRFTAPFPGLSRETIIDDIQFSTQVVPEPATFALLCTGAIVIVPLTRGWRVKRVKGR